MKNRIKVGLVILSSLGGVFAQESGLSENHQNELIDSLQNYELLQNEVVETKLKNTNNVEQSCPEVPCPFDKRYLEKKYISNGYYIVKINFKKLEQFAEQPRAPLIKGIRPFERDTKARDAYFSEVSHEVFEQYIGQNYNRFNDIKLIMITKKNVGIDLQVREASELKEVLQSPYITSVRHIGNPQARLEEIAD